MSTAPHRRKAKGEGHTRRAEILEAAKSLILSEGPERATIRNIAARLGISSTALYLYFPDRDAIMRELCDQAFNLLVASFEAIAAEERAPLDTLRGLMEAYVRFGLDHPTEYNLVFMLKQAMPDDAVHCTAPLSEVPGTLGAQAFAAIRGVVTHLVENNVFIQDNPTKLAELIWMAGHGMVMLLITLPHFPWTEREELIRSGVEMPLKGLLLPTAQERS